MAGVGLAGAVVCCPWDGRSEEDCFFGDGVAGGCADVLCRVADWPVTEMGFHGSCCALNLSNQSLNVATGMAAAAVFSTSRILCKAGWNSSRRYASNRELGVAAAAVDCAPLAIAAAWVMRVSAKCCQVSIPSSMRLISGKSFCASCTSEIAFLRAPISVFSSPMAVWFSIAKTGALRMH